MNPWQVLLLAATALQGGSVAANGPCEVRTATQQWIEEGDIALTYLTQPAPIPVGEHFSLQVQICHGDQPWQGELHVDADMPAHGHGMNYLTETNIASAGEFDAQGFLFHMPGEWRIRFKLSDADSRYQLEHRVIVQ